MRMHLSALSASYRDRVARISQRGFASGHASSPFLIFDTVVDSIATAIIYFTERKRESKHYESPIRLAPKEHPRDTLFANV